MEKTIAFYIGSLSRGGAERVMVNLAEYFLKQEYRVYIVTKMEEKTEYPISDGITRIIADITEEEITENRVKNLCLRIRKLRNIWKKIKPNFIVSFIGKNNFMTIVSSRGLKIPVTVSVRSAPAREYPGKVNRLLMPLLFGQVEGLVLQTKQAKEYFPMKIQRKAVVLPNPINYRFLKPYYEGERSKDIVWVGRIDENKNPYMLLNAFRGLHQEFPDWKVHFYGTGESFSKLQQLCEKWNLTERVILEGRVEKVEEKIDKSSIYVLTSLVEGMPNALMEAMALGLAVVSTDCPCGGPAELIENGKNGLLVPVEDDKALEAALLKLMSDERYRKNLGREAFRIQERLHPDVVNGLWKEYIESRQS